MIRNLCLGAIALAALAAVATPARADDWSKTYALTGRPQLSVEAGDGRVTIVSADQNKIDARVTTEGWRIGSQVQIEESQSGNAVEIRIRIPHQFFTFSIGRRSIHIDLTVPRGSDLDIHTGDGSISAASVSGHIRLDSGDGSISAQGLTGDVYLHSGDGSIEGEGLDGALDASSGDGRIDVRGRFDSLRVKTGDGSVSASATAGSKISTEWSLRSGDGSIRLRLPDSFAANLDAHTGDGRITLDFPVTVSGSLNRSSIQGKIGAGGGPLVLRTGDGSIHLEKL
jgi:hypothetical protein